jgi:hypothetical protein
VRFISVLDAILSLVGAWELFDNLENAAWNKPTDCRVDGDNISDLEFMGHHRGLPRGRIQNRLHQLNSIDVTLTTAHPAKRPEAVLVTGAQSGSRSMSRQRARKSAKASLRSWSVSLIRNRAQFLGFVDAVNLKAAEAAAVKQFSLSDWQRRRLVLQEAAN